MTRSRRRPQPPRTRVTLINGRVIHVKETLEEVTWLVATTDPDNLMPLVMVPGGRSHVHRGVVASAERIR